MTRANRRGWYGESRKHALASKGLSTNERTEVKTPEIKNVEVAPDIVGYDVYHPRTGEHLTYVSKKSLEHPLFREKFSIALPPEQYEWKPVRE